LPQDIQELKNYAYQTAWTRGKKVGSFCILSDFFRQLLSPIGRSPRHPNQAFSNEAY
jgi:hypothetical protein